MNRATQAGLAQDLNDTPFAQAQCRHALTQFSFRLNVRDPALLTHLKMVERKLISPPRGGLKS